MHSNAMPFAPDSRQPWALVVMGVSGSGKSTVAAELALHYGALYLDADDYHDDQARTQMASGVPLTDLQRAPWVARLSATLADQAKANRNTVLAFSGLRHEHRQRLRQSGVPMRFVFLHASPEVIAARLGARVGHFMPAALLDSQFAALQSPDDEPDVVAIDIDGPPAEVLARTLHALEAPPDSYAPA
ncbi:MAG TPA: gluconokinase [Stenotrophomonas sp.]